MRPITFVLSLLAIVSLAGGSSAQTAGTAGPGVASTHPLVIELFTSQGCASCPPSDAFLGELASKGVKGDILALSFHVDYWDYIGWRDPYASPGYTQRQRAYAKALRQRYIYTPEMVVNGIGHDSGMERVAVYELMRRARTHAPPRVKPQLADDGKGGLRIVMPAADLPGQVEVWLLTFDPELRTHVERGENKDRELVNYNVVRSLLRWALWDGKPAEWAVPAQRLGVGRHIAVLIQQPDGGPIVGSAALWRAGGN